MRRWIPGKSAVQLNSIQEEAQLNYKVSEQASLKRNLIMIRYLSMTLKNVSHPHQCFSLK